MSESQVRHIVIEVEPGTPPVINAQGFNIWEASQILYYAYKAAEDEIEHPSIVGYQP